MYLSVIVINTAMAWIGKKKEKFGEHTLTVMRKTVQKNPASLAKPVAFKSVAEEGGIRREESGGHTTAKRKTEDGYLRTITQLNSGNVVSISQLISSVLNDVCMCG